MNTPFGHDAEILRSAIAWALHVADVSNNPLVASFLADSLHHAENDALPLLRGHWRYLARVQRVCSVCGQFSWIGSSVTRMRVLVRKVDAINKGPSQ